MNLNGLKAPVVDSPGRVATPTFDSTETWTGIASGIEQGLHAKAVRDKAQRQVDNDTAIGNAVAPALQDMNAEVFADAQTQQANEWRAQQESNGVTVTDDDLAVYRQAQTLAGTQTWLEKSGQGNTLATLKLNSKKIDFITKRPELAGDFLTVIDKATSASTSLLAKNEDAADTRRLQEQADKQKYMVDTVRAANLYTPGMSNSDVSRMFQEKVRPHLFEQKVAADELQSLKNDQEASELKFSSQFAPNYIVNVTGALDTEMAKVPITQRPQVVNAMINQAVNDVYNMGANAPQAMGRMVEQLGRIREQYMVVATGGKEADAAENAVKTLTAVAQLQARLEPEGRGEQYTRITGVIKDFGGANGMEALLGGGPGSTALADTANNFINGSPIPPGTKPSTVVTMAENTVKAQDGEAPRFPSQNIPTGMSPEYKAQYLTNSFTEATAIGVHTAEWLNKGGERSKAEPAAQNIAVQLADPVISKNGKLMKKFTEQLSDDRIVPLFAGSQHAREAAVGVARYTRSSVSQLDKELSDRYGKPTDQLVNINVDSGQVTVEALPGSPVTDQQAFQLSRQFTWMLRSFTHVKGTTDYDTAAQELFQ